MRKVQHFLASSLSTNAVPGPLDRMKYPIPRFEPPTPKLVVFEVKLATRHSRRLRFKMYLEICCQNRRILGRVSVGKAHQSEIVLAKTGVYPIILAAVYIFMVTVTVTLWFRLLLWARLRFSLCCGCFQYPFEKRTVIKKTKSILFRKFATPKRAYRPLSDVVCAYKTTQDRVRVKFLHSRCSTE